MHSSALISDISISTLNKRFAHSMMRPTATERRARRIDKSIFRLTSASSGLRARVLSHARERAPAR
eukprot:2431336-Pleurochrysis_carterae.AAC.6